MNLRSYERLGMRNSTGAFLTLLVSFAGAAFLLLVVRAILVVRGTTAELVFGQFGADVVAVGASTGSTLDGLAGIVVTVLLGFVVVVIGGQFSDGLDLEALTSRLGVAGQLLTAGFCSVATFRIASSASSGDVGEVVVIAMEVLVTAALAIELTSWLLLKRAKQVAQNRKALERSGERIREGARRLPPMFRRHPCLVTACALVVPAVPSVLAAAFASGARPGFMLIALALSVLTQGAFFVVHWSRIGAGLRWLTGITCTVPALLGFIALLTAVEFAAAGRPWSGVAVGAAFVVPAMTNLSSVRGPSAVSLSLRDAAVWLEVADAVNSRRRALRRLDELTRSASHGDEALLLEWLQRSR